ncbi:MAG: Rieske 2Fe-2S domain-containing protein, partial [Ktedonobacteraceae bacterium]|nr:Rieske 2Fe-2S domain-containing protein [Ktedonobacteraceae bacterium]
MADFIKVADVNELEEGAMMQVEADGELVCLTKVNGTVFALSDNCTHISGPLNEGELEGYEVTCPW